MICIFQDKFQRLISSESSDSKIQPIFCICIIWDIWIALYFNSERIIRENRGWVEIASREATIDDNVIIQIDVVSIGMPNGLFLLPRNSLLHYNKNNPKLKLAVKMISREIKKNLWGKVSFDY